ncbi:MAG: hypothetical protein RL266_557 [Bacteroidota bacterium]
MKRILFSLGFTITALGVSAQNVGIGATSFTPNDDALLELRSTTSGFLMPKMTEAQKNAIATPTEGLIVYQTNATKGFKYFNGTTWAEFGGAADNFGNHVADLNISLDDNWLSNDGGNEGIRIDDNGNVGIGTSAPSRNLEIEVNSSGLNLPLFIHNKNGTNGNNGVGIGFNSETNGDWVKAAIFHERTVGFGRGKMHFLMEDNGDSQSVTLADSKMTIDYLGNVGIGTTSPAARLHTTGTVRMETLAGSGSRMVVTDAEGDLSTQSIPVNHWSLSSGNVYRSSGKVGIGKASPMTNLDMYGNGTSGFVLGGTSSVPNPAEGPEIGFGRGGFYNPGASIQMIDYDGYSAGLAFIVKRGVANGAGGVFDNNFPSDAIQALTIINTGNVGIGTSNPTSKFHVSGDAQISNLAGSGTRMVVADSQGKLSTQAIPSGGSGAVGYGVNGTGDQTISSSSFTDVSSMSLSLPAGTYILQFNAVVNGTNSSSMAEFGFLVNGSDYSPSYREIEPDNNEQKTLDLMCVVTLSSTQTVKTRFRKSSGSGDIVVGNRCFTAIKIG